jgi:hypothetical protein
MSYQAIITHIQVRPHPDPAIKRLAVGSAAGHQVIVGLDTPDNTLGVLFPPDGQLSDAMCHHNNLYRLGKGQNKDPKASGYFEENRRVRTQKFKGIPSEGIWLPVEALAWTGVDLSTLVPGYTFDTLNAKPVCEKYFSPATLRAQTQAKKQGKAVKVMKMFKEHFDTPQLRYTIGSIPDGARLIITEKVHGTSGRSCYGQVTETKYVFPWYIRAYLKTLDWASNYVPLPEWTKINTDSYKLEHSSWQSVLGTRRVVRYGEGNTVNDYYAGTDFRERIHSRMALHKGETIYYEIVGYDGNGGTIMSSYNLDGTDDVHKELRKQYGSQIVFSYGQEVGTCAAYIYRITMTNEDGHSVEYSWDQVVARAHDLGIPTVPPLADARLGPEFVKEDLIRLCLKLSDGASTLDSKHIREGVCVRVEHPRMNTILKLKSFEFCHLEGIAKSFEDYIDTEDIS